MLQLSIAPWLRTSDEDDTLAGLRAPRKRLPWRLLHGPCAAAALERLTALDDYYPARLERELCERHAEQIAHQAGPEPRVVVLGPSSATRRLARVLERPSSLIAVDIAAERVQRLAAALRVDLPGTEVQPVVADYTRHVELPVPQREWRRTLAIVPGAMIGDFAPGEARAFLAMVGDLAGPDRLLLLGADGTRDPNALQRAYDDEAGATAALNKQALAALNASHGATFDLDAFDHRATWNAAASRVELQLVSTRRQLVRIDGQVIALAPGESISTAHCYKHTPEAMRTLLATAGWRTRQVFTSPHGPYRLWLCEAIAK